MGGDLSYHRDDGWTTFDLKLPLQPSARVDEATSVELEPI
jgi:hypothetical protein